MPKPDEESRIVLSVKIVRGRQPAVFESELAVPVSATDDARERAMEAWAQMVDGAVKVAQALRPE